MRRTLLSSIILLFIAIPSFAQFYANEWIDFEQRYVKIRIVSDGIYRIQYEVLEAQLDSMGLDVASLDPRNYQLFNLGNEQAIYVEGEEDGSFDEGDFIEFYGKRNDGTFDSLLFDGGVSAMLHQETSLYNDTAAYYLTWNNSINNLRREELVNNLTDVPAAIPYCISRIATSYNSGWGKFCRGPEIGEIYSSRYEDGEGYSENPINLASYSKTVTTPSIFTGAAPAASCDVVIAAVGPDNHRTIVSMNGLTYEDVSQNGYKVHRFNFDLNNLTVNNNFSITAAGTGASDRQHLSLIAITYPRTLSFSAASTAKFIVPEIGSSTYYVPLSTFNEAGTDPVLYDLDANTRMTAIVEADISKFHLPYDASGNTVYVSNQTAASIKDIGGSNMKEIEFVNFSLPENQGDYILISAKALMDDGEGNNWVQAYHDYRETINGGSFNALVVDVDDLYEQFAYGIRKHSLAIRHFAHYAVDTWDITPQYLFLLGKTYQYFAGRVGLNYTNNYVPTFGHPGSDNLLTARSGNEVPTIATGRLAARTPEQVKIYLDKVIEFEALQADMNQTIDNKIWMKKALHFGGGISAAEQVQFKNFLLDYQDILEDTLYGGEVTNFYKTSTDPISFNPSEKLDSMINAGVSLMTFFGHSSVSSFDYNIGDPADFTNYGKYPFVFGNGCVTGDYYNSLTSLSEDYIFADGRAAIGFLAGSTLSYVSGLHIFAGTFYEHLAAKSYHLGVGKVLKNTIEEIAPSASSFTQLAFEHAALHSDPAIRLNTHELPDYAIETSSVFFDPPLVTVGTDSFDVKVVVSNLGRAVDTSYFAEVKRSLPDGTEISLSKRFDATLFRDTLTFTFFTNPLEGAGLNSLEIKIDQYNEVDELDEFNNNILLNVLIESEDAIPVWPYNFSIVTKPLDYINASTANVFAAPATYIFQIDTTELFNSPMKLSHTMEQGGGVLTWENPPMPWLDSVVYYWRVSVDSTDEAGYSWKGHSFVYIEDYSPGWNQSHFYQFKKDQYKNINLLDNRIFEFSEDIRKVDVNTGVGIPWFQVKSYIDNAEIAIGSCASAGFVSFVMDPNTGLPWESYNAGGGTGPWLDVYCAPEPTQQIIQWFTSDEVWRERLYNFMMDSIPDGHYFIAYNNGYPQFNEWADDSFGPEGQNLFDAFNAYGAIDINYLDTLSYQSGYIFFGVKGDPSQAEEIWSQFYGELLNGTFNIFGNWNEGFFESVRIGPAREWNSLVWRSESIDADPAADEVDVDIFGIDANGFKTLLIEDITSPSYDLLSVDASSYPYLQLRYDARDDVFRTPSQPDYWRVIYDPVPEAALNPSVHFSFPKDSVQGGQDMSLEIAVENISDYDMDSLLIDFAVIDKNNVKHSIPYPRQDSLLNRETQEKAVTWNTRDFPAGNNTLYIEVNPLNDQPEQYHFNNIGYLQFYVEEDLVDPLLDVTFDGVHILDGDIVSSKPEILISLLDENEVLGLTDTSLLRVSLQYPDGTIQQMPFDGLVMNFIPADTSNLGEENKAQIFLKPAFEEDGLYQLIVEGEDVAGNNAGDLAYRIGFEVINKSMISNVYNYPNPFTTSTQFVFTLTGSDLPSYFKIQIMTVSGRIIREIMLDELGPMHIGLNRTEFKWDGTDKYGDEVANGLYLYRVVARLPEADFEHFSTGGDKYFKSGFGKMYFAR